MRRRRGTVGVAPVPSSAVGALDEAWYADGSWNLDRLHALAARARARDSFSCRYPVALSTWSLAPVADDDAVRAVEGWLGAPLPDAYRSYLLEVGGGGLAPARLTATEELVATTAALGFELDPTADFVPTAKLRRGRRPTPIAGAVPIGGFDDGEVVLLAVHGPHRGTPWVLVAGGLEPLVDDGGGDVADGFARWCAAWLDDFETRPGQLVDLRLDDRTTGQLVAIGASAHRRPPDASTVLGELIAHGDPAVEACALRSLAAVDPAAARELAWSRYDDDAEVVQEAVLDVLVEVATEQDIDALRSRLEAEPMEITPTADSRAGQLLSALVGIGTAEATQAAGEAELSRQVGHRLTAEESAARGPTTPDVPAPAFW